MPLKPVGQKQEEHKQEEEPVYVDPDESNLSSEVTLTDAEIGKAQLDQQGFPEALCSATCNLYGRNGSTVMFTIRGTNYQEVLDTLNKALAYANAKYGLGVGADSRQGQGQSRKSPQQEHAVEDQKPRQDGSTLVEKGIGILSKISVSDRVEFSVGSFKYPFKDSRKPEVVAALFDEELGFEKEHFASPAIYTPNDWGDELVAEWEHIEKNGKRYYNVTRVRLADKS